MAALRTFLVSLLAFIAFASPADKEFEDGEIYAKAVGRSGKCLFRKKGKDGKKKNFNKDDGAFVVEVDYVKQKDMNGRDVGKPVPTLASQNFEFSQFNKDASYQGITAGNIDLMAYLKDPQATLKLGIYIFKEAGNLTFGNETYEVDKGIVKFVVKVENYTFCDGNAIPSLCKNNEVGEFLEVAIVMKSKKGKDGKEESEQGNRERDKPGPDGKRRPFRCPRKCPKIIVFGGDEVVVANECQLDGAFTAMPAGFPKLEKKEGKQRFIYRCRRFNNSVVFDPAINMEADEEEEENHAVSIQLSVVMLLVMFLGLFI